MVIIARDLWCGKCCHIDVIIIIIILLLLLIYLSMPCVVKDRSDKWNNYVSISLRYDTCPRVMHASMSLVSTSNKCLRVFRLGGSDGNFRDGMFELEMGNDIDALRNEERVKFILQLDDSDDNSSESGFSEVRSTGSCRSRDQLLSNISIKRSMAAERVFLVVCFLKLWRQTIFYDNT